MTPGLTGTSIFDPVLAECALSWYAPRPQKGETPTIVIDPFAGGSVRGVVASKLGFLYVGTDVSQPHLQTVQRYGPKLIAEILRRTGDQGDGRRAAQARVSRQHAWPAICTRGRPWPVSLLPVSGVTRT